MASDEETVDTDNLEAAKAVVGLSHAVLQELYPVVLEACQEHDIEPSLVLRHIAKHLNEDMDRAFQLQEVFTQEGPEAAVEFVREEAGDEQAEMFAKLMSEDDDNEEVVGESQTFQGAHPGYL